MPSPIERPQIVMSPPPAGQYRWPAEWEPHRATWLVWPHNPHTWPGRFDEARVQFAEFVRAVARFEIVELLAFGDALTSAEGAIPELVGSPRLSIREIPTNDSWIRDHGPVFLNETWLPADRRERIPALVDADYNAWGGKYPPFDLDANVARTIANQLGRDVFRMPIVLEGGAIETNGSGVLLTTASCLLNPNRNPNMDQASIERLLRDYLGVQEIIWLTGEIPGDDTDGHIDQIGRFTDDQTIVLTDLPGSEMFANNRAILKQWARDRHVSLEIVPLRAPEPQAHDGMWLPASYANFCFVNDAVLVPTFANKADAVALRRFEQLVPTRQVIPVPANELIFGLGALHCLSQQEPARGQSS